MTASDPTAPEPVGHLDAVALDCPDPAALAAFYGRVLGAEMDSDSTEDDWVQLHVAGGAMAMGSGVLAFQRVDDRPPQRLLTPSGSVGHPACSPPRAG